MRYPMFDIVGFDPIFDIFGFGTDTGTTSLASVLISLKLAIVNLLKEVQV